jgi:3-mercaptopyruvate sulfurtransferase SseA
MSSSPYLWALIGVLLLGATLGAQANPQEYGQFAQREVSKDIQVTFVTAETVKQRLDAGTPQWLVDVRNRSSYDRGHLPGARLLPLEEFPQRFAEIPRDIPVVLY